MSLGSGCTFETRYEKSEKVVNIATCRVKKCAFRVRAIYRPKLGCVVITKLISEHTACIGVELGNRRKASKHKYLRKWVPTITVVRETTPKDVINAVQHNLLTRFRIKLHAEFYALCQEPILKWRESSSNTWEHQWKL